MNILKNHIIVLILMLPVFYPCSVPAIDFFTDKDVIWQASNNEYFKYTDQDTTSLGKNDHPVELEAKEISAILGSLKIREEDNNAAEKEFKAVFSTQQTNMLSQYLAKGLRSAKPNQDIIFAMEKSVDRYFGLKPNRFFVAGRVFYKDNKLNIIIGDYDRLRNDAYESAYDPTHTGIVRYHFDHGKRLKNSRFTQTIISIDGVENKQLNNTRRSDWLVIDVNVALKAYDQMIRTRKNEEMAEKRKELREVLGSEETGHDEDEHEALRRKVEQLEQELQSGRSQQAETGTTNAGKPATTTAAPATGHAPAETSLEQRLKVLKSLLDQGLVSEEIYNAKVKELLDENL